METGLINTASLPERHHIIVKTCGNEMPELVRYADTVTCAQMMLHNIAIFMKHVTLKVHSASVGMPVVTTLLYKGNPIMQAFKAMQFTIESETYTIHRVGDIKEHFMVSYISTPILQRWLFVLAT